MAYNEPGAISRFFIAFLKGPPAAHTHSSLVDRCFPWWARLVVVALMAAIGRSWAGNPLGEQVGGALQYSGLCTISLAVSFWWYFFVGNMVLALWWLIWPAANPKTEVFFSQVQAGLTFVNRQVGHFQALTAWAVFAVVSTDTVAWQLPAAVAVLLLGEPLVNWLTEFIYWLRGDHPLTSLAWRRRPVIYAVTYLAIGLIALLATKQAFKLLPGVLAVIVADILRIVRHLRWSRYMGFGKRLHLVEKDAVAPWTAKDTDTENPQPVAVTDFHADHHAIQMRWARHSDFLLGPGLVVVGMLLLVGANALLVRDFVNSFHDRSRGEPLDYHGMDFPNAPKDELALFLLSDNQFHELRGHRFTGQMALAEALVPVASRPIELDLLAAAPLWHFGSLYREMAQERGGQFPWAHLGDLADLACQDELNRATNLLKDRLGLAAFVGMAPGNHDKTFTGNFFWNPNWDLACPSGRLEKTDSDRLILTTWNEANQAGASASTAGLPAMDRVGIMRPVPSASIIAATTRRGTALVTVSPLGAISRLDRTTGPDQGVLGIFLDSSDGQAFDFGISGMNGTFSSAQAKEASRVLDDVRKAAVEKLGKAYADPLYLVFLHHPLARMIWPSDKRLRDWLAQLEPKDPRILGVISAHTHKSQSHGHCIGKRIIPEIVVGSTLDPPQEAALLTAGATPDGVPGLRVQTLPAISRFEAVPSAAAAADHPTHPTAQSCQAVIGKLRAHPDCDPMFRGGGAAAQGRDCAEIERTLDLKERLFQALRYTGPVSEANVIAVQRAHAKALWNCVCRDSQCSPSVDTLNLDDRAYFPQLLGELGKGAAREEELTCLAWAAAMVQRYKTGGMTFAEALRCGFDGNNVPAGKDFIARMEVIPCR